MRATYIAMAGMGLVVSAAEGQTYWDGAGWPVQGQGGYTADPSPIVDAMGDAVDTFGAGAPLLDMDTISVTYTATDLIAMMTFHTPISQPSKGFADGVVGFFEFDTDQSSETGIAPLQNVFVPPFTPLDAGVDYYLDLFSEPITPGMVPLVRAVGGIVGLLPITYDEMSFSVTVPLELLSDGGVVDFTAIIGTVPQPTDAMEVIGTSVPAPGTGLLLALAGIGVGRRRARARSWT